MSLQFNNLAQFEAAVSDAVIRAAQLAREDAIKTNTGIVIKKNGRVVEISAVKKHHLAEQNNQHENHRQNLYFASHCLYF